LWKGLLSDRHYLIVNTGLLILDCQYLIAINGAVQYTGILVHQFSTGGRFDMRAIQ